MLPRKSSYNSQGVTDNSSSNSDVELISATHSDADVKKCGIDDDFSDSPDFIPSIPKVNSAVASSSVVPKSPPKEKSKSPPKLSGNLLCASDLSFDSDLDVIESTPEAKVSTKSSTLNLDLSPDVIPPTPQSRPASMSNSLLIPKIPSARFPKSSLSLLSSRSLHIKKNTSHDIKPKPISLKSKFSHKKDSSKLEIKPLVPLQNKGTSEEKDGGDVIMDEEKTTKESGKEYMNLMKNSLKRAAISGTGISPDFKRVITSDSDAEPVDVNHCRSNLLGRFNASSPIVSGSESDSSFSLLQGNMMSQVNKKMNKNEVLKKSEINDVNGSVDISIEIQVPAESDNEKDKSIALYRAEDAVNNKLIPEVPTESNDEKVAVLGTSEDDLNSNKFIKEVENTNDNDKNKTVIPETQGAFPEGVFASSQGFSMEIEDKAKIKDKKNALNVEVESRDFVDNCLFDDELSLDFENMSPFKEQLPVVAPVPENKAVKKLLNEGICEDSYAIRGDFGRHVVTGVEHHPYRGEVLLHVTSLREKLTRTCSLRGFWTQSAISEGDVVHILYADYKEGHYTIDNSQGLLVINPDYLISGTSVVSAVFCRRKSVLNERFRGLDSSNKLMLVGSLTHQLFQDVVKDKITSQDKLQALVKHLMAQPSILRDMYGLGVSEAEIYEDMNNFLPRIHSWSQRYLGSGLVPTEESKERRNQWRGNIKEIQDIEENVWSPKYGIKGKIDLTVKTSNRGVSKVVPLELKTGRSSFSAEHRGQVTLYSMMSGDRREDPKSGLLLYLK